MVLRDTNIFMLVALVCFWLSCCGAAFIHNGPYGVALAPPRLWAVADLSTETPSWKSLEEQLLATETGMKLDFLQRERGQGRGPPHARSRLRLFDEVLDESSVRVTFYRDDSAWCPYCQKVWLLLEEKRIPYKIKTVPLNAYGDKPAWYTQLVDGGKLPALELDGSLHVESFDIMKLLDQTFDGRPMLSEALDEELLELEKRIQRDWFSLVFYPVEGEALVEARKAFVDTLNLLDAALGATPGPWLEGHDSPSLLDIEYIPMMERIEASVLYWRNIRLRGSFPNIDAWVEAWEQRPSYMATKSDYYTLCLSIPSQNGPGYFSPDAKDIAARIYGLDGAWTLPLSGNPSLRLENSSCLEQLSARHEAAFELIKNHKAISEFCARAAGEPGRPAFHAELSDPYAAANLHFVAPVDLCLRHVTSALIRGADSLENSTVQELRQYKGNGELQEGWEAYEEDGRTYFWNCETGDVKWSPPTGQLDSCLAYLRDRIGVPRDMSYAAAMQLRAHLNWAIDLVKNG